LDGCLCGRLAAGPARARYLQRTEDGEVGFIATWQGLGRDQAGDIVYPSIAFQATVSVAHPIKGASAAYLLIRAGVMCVKQKGGGGFELKRAGAPALQLVCIVPVTALSPNHRIHNDEPTECHMINEL